MVIRLASGSLTRAKMLKEAKVEFIQTPVDFNEESIKADTPRGYVYYVAKGKLLLAKEKFGLNIPILTADSVVVKGGKILKKPKDINEARELLLQQSGSEISIVTSIHYESKNLYFCDTSATYYQFAPFDKEDLNRYLNSKEWEGKAGGCMVEGFCKKYIKRVNGLESCAMGLTLEKLLVWLEFDSELQKRD
ncbi:MAG: septum formation inhibitor Maf [Epsilonproteobacteria bacterium]|nr:septum formation inhibitor Maf [Campylobacterota bacterium]